MNFLIKRPAVFLGLIASWILYPTSVLLGSQSELPEQPFVMMLEKTPPSYQIPGKPTPTPDELIQELEAQSSKQPSVAEIWYQLGLAYAQQKQLDRAIQALQTAVKLDSHHVKAWNNLGSNLNDEGKTDEALQAYTSATQADPSNGTAWNGLALDLLKLKRFDESGAALTEGVKVDPNSRRLWNSLGVVRLGQSRFGDAVDAFRHAISIDPGYAIGWCNLGLAQSQLNNQDEAITSLQEAADLDPKLVPAWNNLAGAYAKNGQLSKCDDAARRSIALSYNQPRLWAWLANVSFMHGKWEDSVEKFSVAVDRLGLNYADAISEYGEAAAHIAHFADAEKLIDQAQKMDANSSFVLEHQGYIRAIEGRAPEAYDAFQKSLQINPNDERDWGGLGIYNESQSKFDEAVACYQKAVDITPDMAGAWKGLARCYQHLGKTEEAAKASAKVSQLNGVTAPDGHR